MVSGIMTVLFKRHLRAVIVADRAACVGTLMKEATWPTLFGDVISFWTFLTDAERPMLR
jgi:hypothetical protein